MKYIKTIIKGNEKTVIKVSLDDDCKNGHEDFSLTADIYEKDARGIWRDVGCGCYHEHICKVASGFKPFADLHLSTWQGVPMHAFGNAWYWFQGAFPESANSEYHGGSGRDGKPAVECKRIFAEHIRANNEQVEAIAAAMPRSQDELQAVLEDFHFPEQWKREADSAILTLENLTGEKFKSKATRGAFEPLSADKRKLINDRLASGYYLPENVAKRDTEAKEADKQKRLASLRKDYEVRQEKLKRCFDVESQLIEKFGRKLNFIYYDHTNTLSANWSTCEKLLTKDEFDAITQALDYSTLPAGIKTVWNERPKY